MIFDVAIIGAGVCGAAIARQLSRYRINVAVLEKCADASFGVSKANSGIVHAGFHHAPGSLKARLEIRGNLMFEKLQEELGFPFKRVGILMVAFSDAEMQTVRQLYERGLANGVPGLEIIGKEKVQAMEPEISRDAIGALYAPTGGVIEPYRYVFSLMESAEKNGVELFTNFKVTSAENQNDEWQVCSEDGRTLQAKYVVNAAGLYADEVSRIFSAEEFQIKPRKGEEYLLQRGAAGFPNHVLFPVPAANSKGILVIPTVEGTMMIGPTATETENRNDLSTTAENLDIIFSHAQRMVPEISRKDVITSFAGLRPTLANGDFFIDISRKSPRFIQVAGIQSPGLTASPAIGEYVKDLLKKAGLSLTEKNDYQPYLEKQPRIRELAPERAAELVAKNPRYGNIVCRCENVSEEEIVQAIRKGHTTLDGIKLYTRAGMGRCQGGFCTYRILRILERETGMSPEEITRRGRGSELIIGRIGRP